MTNNTVFREVAWFGNKGGKMTRWIKPYELAKIKNVSLQTVYRWIRENKIPKEKVRTIEIIVKRKEIQVSN